MIMKLPRPLASPRTVQMPPVAMGDRRVHGQSRKLLALVEN